MSLTCLIKTLVSPLVFLCFVFIVFELSQGTVTAVWVSLYPDYDSETNGFVLRSDYISPGGFRSPDRYDIAYSYTVGEDIYISSRGVVGGYDFSQKVKETIDKYQVGDTVKVYYDSSKPNYSTLDVSGMDGILLLKVGAIFSFFILHCFYKIVSCIRINKGAV